MTELGLTPSQTAGPYLRIGLLRNLITTELVDPGDPRAIRIRGRLTDAAGERSARRHGRDLAGERGRPLPAPGRRP